MGLCASELALFLGAEKALNTLRICQATCFSPILDLESVQETCPSILVPKRGSLVIGKLLKSRRHFQFVLSIAFCDEVFASS